jgi:VWFA-related protein
MKKQQGRKAFILMTDGVDNGSKVGLTEAIESAQRADTLVYSIYFEGEQQRQFSPGLGGPGMGRRGGMGGGGRRPQQQHEDGKKILERISKETGGSFFHMKKDLDKIFDQIEEELRSQYSLGYTPDKTDTGGYRKLHVATAKKGLVVQARDGYYAAST